MQKTMYTTVPLLYHNPCDAILSLELNVEFHSVSFVYTTAHFCDINPTSDTLQH